MIKCAMFDLDGTLINTLPTITHYVNATLTKNGFEGISLEDCRLFVGNGARNLIERALSFVGADVPRVFDKVFRDYNAAYDSAPNYLATPYEGILELVDALFECDVRLAVLSNKPDLPTRLTVREFFGDRFAYVRGGIPGEPLKPDPTVPLKMLSELCVSPEECAYIGDSEVDALTGINMRAGLRISCLWGFRTKEEILHGISPDAYPELASSPDEILRLIKSH
ncbi:MAG: HAD family hydrolase [Clostridia bacterium]|nr:HAD family hydrolase [Clostridia bacterium]